MCAGTRASRRETTTAQREILGDGLDHDRGVLHAFQVAMSPLDSRRACIGDESVASVLRSERRWRNDPRRVPAAPWNALRDQPGEDARPMMPVPMTMTFICVLSVVM
jgi:hypothetical protein